MAMVTCVPKNIPLYPTMQQVLLPLGYQSSIASTSMGNFSFILPVY